MSYCGEEGTSFLRFHPAGLQYDIQEDIVKKKEKPHPRGFRMGLRS
jgi:hypothetical protein